MKPLLLIIPALACCAALAGAATPQRADDDPLPPDPDAPKETAKDWAGWKQVLKLRGESQAQRTKQYDYNPAGSTKQETSRRWARVSFVMELQQPVYDVSTQIGWRVIEAKGSSDETHSFRQQSSWLRSTGTTTGSYSGPMSLRTDPGIYLNLKDGKWGFLTLLEPAQPYTLTHHGEIYERRSAGDRNETINHTQPGGSLENGWITDSAPKTVGQFGGSCNNIEDYEREDGRESIHNTFNARVQFWPEWDDVEVIVEIEGYSKWLPKGNVADANNPSRSPLDIFATLRPKSKNPTPAQIAALPEVRRFRFELSDTSREPGVCMNWPVFGDDASAVPKEDPDYDLRFGDLGLLPTQFSPKKQKAGVKPFEDRQGRPAAWVMLDCYDFGAYADLRVVAELADGREVAGFIEASDGPRYTITIPERDGRSLIAKAWRDAEKVTDDDSADIDTQPEADGQKGDGFSAYEEYRGFRCYEAHKRLKPDVKDLFVANIIGARAEEGLDVFMRETADSGGRGFQVHYHLYVLQELPNSRAINLNRSAKSPRTAKEPQHALLLVKQTGGDISEADFDGRSASVGWRPKNVVAVRILDLSSDRDFKSTVAHEISHAIGARHHGEIDRGRVIWERVRKTGMPAGAEPVYEFREWGASYDSSADGGTGGYVKDAPSSAGSLVRLFRESGVEIDPNSAKAAEVFAEACRLWLGVHRGQHSGMHDCWMRYDCARAFVPPGRPGERVYHNAHEDPGLSLCVDEKGTGVNAPDYNNNNPRYGPATRGKCHRQLCVRDDAPDQAAKS